MAKEVKTKWLGGRVDDAFDAEVAAYVAASTDLTQGELVRRGVADYMKAHPLKDPASKVDSTKVKKPGE